MKGTGPSTPLRAWELLPVLAVAAWARLAVFPRVLLGQGVFPASGDADYHLRRMLLAFESFPAVSVFDPLLGWPAGQAHPCAPAFDWTGALFLHLTFLRDPASLTVAAAFFPVVLGLVTVFLVMDVTALLLSSRAHRLTPLAAGVLAGLAPQFVAASRLGCTDHQVWEGLSVLLLLRWGLSGLDPAPCGGLRFELTGVLAVGVTLSGLVGGPLDLALVLPLLVMRALSPASRSLWGSGAAALVVGAALSGLINLGPIGEHGQVFSAVFPSLLQPLLGGGAACVVALACRAPFAGPALMHGGVLAALLGLALLSPGVGLLTVTSVLGLNGLVALPLLVEALISQPERRRRAAGFTLVFGALVALTWLEARFGRVLAPLLGIASAVGLSSLALRLGPRATHLPVAATVLLCLADPAVRSGLMLADDRDASAIEVLSEGLALGRAPQPRRGDGVLASAELGNTLLTRSQRPVIASGFGPRVDPEGLHLSVQAFARDERALLEVMSKRDLGFVVSGAAVLREGPGQRPLLRRQDQHTVLDPEAFRARPIATLMMGGSGLPGEVAHAEHLMPTQASEQQVEGVDWPLPSLWSYERVVGATVSADCVPGQLLVAGLDALVGTRPFRWTAWARCDASGRGTLRLCVPSGVERPGFVTARAWRLPGERRLVVDEAAIRAGAALE